MLLEVGPLSACFGSRVLYRDLWLSLAAGELVSLHGPSGSGKSTLLRQVVGLAPAAGVRRVLGEREFAPQELCAFRRHCLLLLPEAPVLAGTVEDNLRFPFAHRLARRAFDREEARRWWRRLGLSGVPWDRPARLLSLGERKRLALVRALIWDPVVLLADEPLSGLDDEARQRAVAALADFARRPGRAVLCVTHGELGAAHRRLVLREGRLAET